MRVLTGILIYLTVVCSISAQVEVSIITPYDSALLVNMPELKATPVLKSSDLPYALDNSYLPYFRPIYEQVASECSQVSAIGYNFTYEINRLRDLPASDSANQYPPHFPYNFANGGSGWNGVSYYHSFEVLKALGCPDVETYGGMAAGGPTRWMSGYDEYLIAMSNRIQQVYQIKVGTEEGLMQLKQWLHNHLEGSEYGGVASFYSNAPWNMRYLPTGTHEAGKRVIVHWQGLPTHAMTITGYNDSICWDYNLDGQYTNHIDINEDGVVNMRDWEVGGLIFADGWDGGINHGDSGKCYMMYKTLAENVYEGGIWNHVVHVVDAKSVENPALTARINMNHDRRNTIKVRCGVASSVQDTLPEYIIDFPVFDFQGGAQYMQGGTEPEENKNIEFGLDITPLLGLLESESTHKFFLVIEERDPDSLGQGYVREFSVIDYSGGIPTEESMLDSIPILNNGITYIPLTFTGELDIMKIVTDELPEAIVGNAYYFELEATGGTAPINWKLLQAVEETETEADTDTTGTYLEPDHWEYGNIPYELPFSFHFYGKAYDSIFIHPAGFIMFENTSNPWPYIMDPKLFVRDNRIIAPLLCRYFEYIPAFSDGIWVNDQEDNVKITWRSRVDYPGYLPLFEFALEIHEDGRMIFVYGNDFDGYHMPWTCGISKGDGLSVYFPAIADRNIISEGEAVSLGQLSLPPGMSFDDEGIFSGTPSDNYNAELLFCAEDYDHKRSYRSLHFNASGLGIDETENDISLLVYPNPSSGTLYLKYSISDTHVIPSAAPSASLWRPMGAKGRYSRFELYSAHGVKVSTLLDRVQQAGDHLVSYDFGDLPAGIYFLNIQAGDSRYTKKIIYTGP